MMSKADENDMIQHNWTADTLRAFIESNALQSLCFHRLDYLRTALNLGQSPDSLQATPEQWFLKAKLKLLLGFLQPQLPKKSVLIPRSLILQAKDLIHPEKRSDVSMLTRGQLSALAHDLGFQQMRRQIDKFSIDGKLLLVQLQGEGQKSRKLVWLRGLLYALKVYYNWVLKQQSPKGDMDPFIFFVRQSFRKSVLGQSMLDPLYKPLKSIKDDDKDRNSLNNILSKSEAGSAMHESVSAESLAESTVQSELGTSTPMMLGSVYVTDPEYREFKDAETLNNFIGQILQTIIPLPFRPELPERITFIELTLMADDSQQVRRFGVAGVHIGRSQNNDISFPQQPTISSLHASIFFDDKFFVQDLGSKIGTFLRVERTRVEEGTELYLGSTLLVLKQIRQQVIKLQISKQLIIQNQIRQGQSLLVGSADHSDIHHKDFRSEHGRLRLVEGQLFIEEAGGNIYRRLSRKGETSRGNELQQGSEFRILKTTFRVSAIKIASSF